MNAKGHYQSEADIAKHIYIKEDPLLANVGHFHEGVEIVALLEGVVDSFHVGEKKRLQAGEIVFVDSFECHHYSNVSSEIKAIVIVLSSEYTKTFREFYAGNSLPCYLCDVEKNKDIICLMRQWLSEPKKSFVLNVGYCNVMLAKLVEAYGLKSKDNGKDKVVSVKLLQYVNDHYTEDISLTEISKQLGYTKEYCSKIFSDVVGMSFRDYLNSLRMKKASEYFAIKKELRMSTMEIIYKCGFNSASTFYRALKAYKKKNIKY